MALAQRRRPADDRVARVAVARADDGEVDGQHQHRRADRVRPGHQLLARSRGRASRRAETTAAPRSRRDLLDPADRHRRLDERDAGALCGARRLHLGPPGEHPAESDRGEDHRQRHLLAEHLDRLVAASTRRASRPGAAAPARGRRRWRAASPPRRRRRRCSRTAGGAAAGAPARGSRRLWRGRPPAAGRARNARRSLDPDLPSRCSRARPARARAPRRVVGVGLRLGQRLLGGLEVLRGTVAQALGELDARWRPLGLAAGLGLDVARRLQRLGALALAAFALFGPLLSALALRPRAAWPCVGPARSAARLAPTACQQPRGRRGAARAPGDRRAPSRGPPRRVRLPGACRRRGR